MWSEARKQEKKIRGIMVDYRKRADRRKEFYERIRADPVSFLQLHGRKIKINFDIHDTTETSMMPWQGQKDNMIDRFDVRAHLDHIPPQKPTKDEEIITEPLTNEDRQVNYERYRILAQNEFLGINEEKFLAQLFIEEQFGNVTAQLETDKGSKKKNSQASAAIGYNYEENTPQVPFSQTINSIESSSKNDDFNGTKDDSDDSDLDMDISIDINKIPTLQANELNAAGRKFGMHSNDYFSFLTKDEDEKETLRAQKEAEAEKVMLVGRKSRRERRSQREKRYLGRPLSPPSYAAKEEEISKTKSCEKSESRSPSPENSGKITYITSFGGEDELQPHSKISISLNKPLSRNQTAGNNNNRLNSYAEKVKQNLDKLKRINKLEKPGLRSRSRSNSRSRNRRRSPYRKSRSLSRKRSHRKSRSVSRKRRYSTSSSSSSTSRSRSRSRRRRLSRQRRNKKSFSSSSSSSSSSRSRRYSKSPEKKLQNKSKSKSPPKAIQVNAGTSSSSSSALITEQQTTVRKYYGRKRDDDSSELSVDEEEEIKSVSNDSSTNNKSFNRFPESKVNSSNVPGYTGHNPRERLKKKMQILLNKQYKADKAKEGERIEKQMQMQHEREEEMRELALKLRRRQRELRHKYGSPSNQHKSSDSEENGNLKREVERRPRSSSSSSSSSSSHHSRSRSRDKKRYKKSPSRSRSNSRGGGSRQRRSRSRDRFEGRRRNYRDYDYRRSRS